MNVRTLSGLVLCLTLLLVSASGHAGSTPLVRPAPEKKQLTAIPAGIENGTIVFKLAEGLGQPSLSGNRDRKSKRLNSSHE